MFLRYYYFILNILFISKKKFLRPKQKNFLIINGDHSELFKSYFKENEIDIVYNRFARGIEKDSIINLYILLITILKFKFSIKEYIKNYIRACKPKAIITLIDNDRSFYELKNKNSNFKSIVIQNSFRSTQNDLFAYLDELKEKKIICDYVLTFNKYVGNYYKKFLKGHVKQIGAFKSNCIKIKNFKKKYDIMYVSSFKGHSDSDLFIKSKNITYGDIRRGEYKLIENMRNFFRKNKKIKLNILGKKNKAEEPFWEEKLKGVDYNFLPQSDNRDTYKIIDETRLLISIDSTLGYESIARGNKICVFSVRGNNYPVNSSKFGWPHSLNNKGFFWTDSTEYKEFEKIINLNFKISEKNYFNNKVSKIIPGQIIYDKDNLIFRKLINSLR